MAFILSLIAGFGAFFVGQETFRRMRSHPVIDSLRTGKAHYLLLGVFVGMFLPEIDSPFEQVRSNCIGVILLYFGLQAGLSTDRQHLNLGISAIYSQATVVLCTAGFVILAVLASGSTLYRALGLLQNLPLAIALLTSFALTARFPAPFFYASSPLSNPVPGQNLPLCNIAAMAVLSIAFPFLTEKSVFYFGSLPFIGVLGAMLFAICLGVSGGVALDISFRSHRTGPRALGIVIGIVITLFGLCQVSGVPSLVVGFLAGIWLIHATVAKRELVAITARTTDVIEPIFFALFGTVIGEFVDSPSFFFFPLFFLSVTMLSVRAMGRTIGFAISQAVWQIPRTWRELIGASWHPQGTLAVAVAAQAGYILEFQHIMLIASLVLCVFLSQIALIPPAKQSHF